MSTCVTCTHSRAALTDDDDGDGPQPFMECWRYPPLMVVVDDVLMTARPQVTETDTCGEHAEA